MSGRISALKTKITRLEDNSFKLELANIRLRSYAKKLDKNNKDSANLILKQVAKISELETNISLKTLASRNREIINLKQDLQCSQVIKDGLQMKLEQCQKNLTSANETIDRLHEYIEATESKKFKNRIKRLIAG